MPPIPPVIRARWSEKSVVSMFSVNRPGEAFMIGRSLFEEDLKGWGEFRGLGSLKIAGELMSFSQRVWK